MVSGTLTAYAEPDSAPVVEENAQLPQVDARQSDNPEDAGTIDELEETQLQEEPAPPAESLDAESETMEEEALTPGDLNGDGKSTLADLALVVAAFGKTAEEADWDLYKQADLNSDEVVDFQDTVRLADLLLAEEATP
ncbi:hypothetical protein [Cohnella sp. 56]|uniref:hypothetical protein n=1 Tax=Cohnella sp. 56 TaxID=3113722 RepID=UPI0030EA3D4D